MEPEGSFRIYKHRPRAPILSQIDPVHTPHPISQKSILKLSAQLCLDLPSDLISSGFPTKTLYARLLSPIRATCPANFSRNDLITQTIFREEYRAESFSTPLLPRPS